MKINRNNEYHQLKPLTKHFNKTCSNKWLRNRLKIMISLPHTPTSYEISARSILLKFLISTHACLFIHTASYTIIRSILSGTYMNVPPYTLVRTYTDTEFYTFATLYCYFTYTVIWNSGVIISACALKSPYKIKPGCHMLIYKTSHYIKCIKPKQNHTLYLYV